MIKYFIENGASIVAVLVAVMYAAKLITNLTPGLADDGLFKKLDDFFDTIIPNYKKQNNDEGNTLK